MVFLAFTRVSFGSFFNYFFWKGMGVFLGFGGHGALGSGEEWEIDLFDRVRSPTQCIFSSGEQVTAIVMRDHDRTGHEHGSR
jgi:hypothetical protein